MITTIKINKEDWEWMKERGYKATNLLRIKMKEMQRDEKTQQSKEFAKAIRFIEKEGLMQKFRGFI